MYNLSKVILLLQTRQRTKKDQYFKISFNQRASISIERKLAKNSGSDIRENISDIKYQTANTNIGSEILFGFEKALGK